MDSMWTTAELAEKWRKSPKTISKWAKEGLLEGAEKPGRDWRFPPTVRYVGHGAGKPTSPAAQAQDIGRLLALSRQLERAARG